MESLRVFSPRPLRGLALLTACLLVVGCATSHLRQGNDLAEEGKWDAAVAAYREALKERPFDDDIQAKLTHAKEKAAANHYDLGKTTLQHGHIEQAVHEFEWAVGYDPSRREHHAALADALRLQEARKQLAAAQELSYMGRLDDSLVAYERAVHLDPTLAVALDGITEITVRQRASRALAESVQPVTLRFQKAKLREVFEILARTAGVNVVFDKDVRDDPVTIFLKDMPYDDALKLILNTHNLLAHRVADDTILITPNTKQKQAQYQDLMIRTYYLSNAQAKNVVNLLRAMLESKRVYADEDVNAVVVRDEPAKLHLAERVIHAIDRRQPEVVLDVEVLEVNRTKSLTYGINVAKSAAGGIRPPGFSGELTTSPTQFTFQQLTNIGTSSYLFTIPATLLVDFFKQESDARTLASPKLRVVNKQKATINVGDKQPILLSTTNVLPGQAATGAVPTTSTVTSIEFKDTGIKLTVEPTVHLMGELTLKLTIEVTRLGDEVILQDSPEIKQFRFGTRTAETTLRIRDGETVVLAGLISDEHRRSRQSVLWVDKIPLIGDLLTSTKDDIIETEIVATITPHIVAPLQVPSLNGQLFWSGTQDQFATTPLFTPEPTMISHRGGSSSFAPAAGGASEAEPVAPCVDPPKPSDAAPSGATDARLGEAGTGTPSVVPEASKRPPEAARVPPAAEALTPPEPQVPRERESAPPTETASAQAPKTVAGGAGVLAIRPARLVTTVGQQFRVDLTADQVGSFAESEIAVSFNPQLVDFVRALPGEVLTGESGPAAAAVAEPQASGRLVLRLQRQAGAQAVTGTLASLFFRAKSPGTSHVVIEPTKVAGPEGRRISVTARPGAVVVR